MLSRINSLLIAGSELGAAPPPFAQRVEVDARDVRIMAAKSELPHTLVAVSGAKSTSFGVSSFVPKWRARQDSNL